MRLWHKELIYVLPKQQLLSQWRECCSIAKRIAEKGTPNHILVNRVLEYPVDNFVQYTEKIIREFDNRGFKISEKALENFRSNIEKGKHRFNNQRICGLFINWHNDIYLRECLYNLEEKYLCGGISGKEWNRICCRFGSFDLFIYNSDK